MSCPKKNLHHVLKINKSLATIDDRTGGNFICSTMVIAGALAGAALGAFIFFTGGAGAVALGSYMAMGAAGGAVAIATVATGGLLLVAVGVAVAAIGVSAFAADREISHNCDITLQSKWINFHDKVTINGHPALLQNSKMICKKGGGLTLVVDPVLARAAAQRIAANNQKEYDAHVSSAYIQGTLFLLSSKGDPRALAVGLPLTIWNYNNSENSKQETRAKEIEDRITNPDAKSGRDGFFGAVAGEAGTVTRDAVIGTGAEVIYKNPILITAVRTTPTLINGAMRSQYPMLNLQLGMGIMSAGVQRSFTNPGILKGLGEGFAWGMAGAAVDAGFDVYENSIYDDTLKYFRDVLSVENSASKGINIIAKTK